MIYNHLMSKSIFKIHSPFKPAGDQPTAIAELTRGIQQGEKDQVLLGVTGSGKTFTIAHTIQNVQKPTLLLAHNKTLAAQLYNEMKTFFPDNAVEYFVSYYDYYQPEAYVARTDTFIEKEATINEQIDRMRHSATRALLERRDVIIVASISCIYGIGGVETYAQMTIPLKKDGNINQQTLLKQLTELQYKRNDTVLTRGTFRVRGDIIDVFPAHLDDRAWRVSLFGNTIETINEFDPLTGKKHAALDAVTIYPNSHYVTPKPTVDQAIYGIKDELKERVKELNDQGKLVESQRINQRTTYDLEMLAATGMCQGIENYSRYLTGRAPGSPPPTLFEYLSDDALLVIDESHATVPQIRAMYRGDAARKTVLSEHGFRLPSCKDNRPLKFEEWYDLRPQTIYVSATPSPWELEQTDGVFAEQVVRPTGLLDPILDIRPTETQVDDLIAECKDRAAKSERVLVTTLTKKLAEALTEYLNESGVKTQYMHSDIDTLERTEIIRGLRDGTFDVLVGINLLREGLDIPECSLVAILDADKEGFLRSRMSLIQTVGRAARNVNGRAILYADRITASIQATIDETTWRREKQEAHNKEHNITPTSVHKKIFGSMHDVLQGADIPSENELPHDHKSIQKRIKEREKEMIKAAENLEFEQAAKIRDEIKKLEAIDLAL